MMGRGSMKFILTCAAKLLHSVIKAVYRKRKMKLKARFLGYRGRTESLGGLVSNFREDFQVTIEEAHRLFNSDLSNRYITRLLSMQL